MNKAQKEAQYGLLKNEEECMKALEKAYKQAMSDLKKQIKEWGDEGNLTPSQVYQKKWQEAVYGQVSGIIDNMHANQYDTMQDYLTGCYEDSYAGVMYDLTKQGIPVAVPIQQDQVVKAVTTDSKLSQKMYAAMGKYLKPLKKQVAQELSRGFASNLHFNDIARNIENRSHIGLSNAQRIARTEGHRIQNAAALDAQKAAKESGADVVKQWDSTMDGKTRKTHRKLDGQIREIDEPFEVNGHKAMAPGQFGRPEEDINCRCAILQRAKWALDDDELKALEEKAAFWGIDKSDDLDTFREKYIEGAKKEQKLKDLSAQLAKEQKKLDDMNNTYTGIWKDDVTLDDYEDKKNSIAAKEAYYNAQMDLLDPDNPADLAKHMQFTAHLDELSEFKALGPKYAKQKAKVQKLRDEIKDLMPKPDPGDAFSQERKDAAYWFTNRNGSTRAADKVLRKKCGDVWRSATKAQREGIYGYTAGSGAWNRPLSGFQKPWSQSGSGWEPKFYKGPGKVWIDYEGHGNAIRRMTEIIGKSSYDFDIWLQRGCGYSAMESFFGIPYGKMGSMTAAQLQQYVGHSARIESFVSTSVSKGNGFSGDVIMNIYAPEGTNMMYAEPFSRYGNGGGKSWDGTKSQSSFGSEAEMIIQRGASYTVTKIEKTGGRVYIDLEVHPEDGYDLFQQDPKEWNGSKEQYR